MVPIFLARASARSAVQRADEADQRAVVVPFTGEASDPNPDDLERCGVVVRVAQVMKLPDGSMRAILEGEERIRVVGFDGTADEISVRYVTLRVDSRDSAKELPRLIRIIRDAFDEYVKVAPTVPSDVKRKVRESTQADRIVDTLAAHIPFPVETKLFFLKEEKTVRRCAELADALAGELELLKLKRSIKDRVRKRIEKSQRQFFLQEQVKEINKELGQESVPDGDRDDLSSRIEKANLPEEVAQKARKELARLEKLPPVSPESGIIRTYLDYLIDLPWQIVDKNENERPDLSRASDVLETDHYGMRKPKDRLLEYMAVQTLNATIKGPILCFVGPPGTGKTSLGESLARALDRRFVRLALGGVRDEAEIRGHRRTYVGAMPGRIIQAIKKAGSRDPVILLDEIDKIGSDWRGDPSSALLEVLDPEQNSTFSDHYIELPFDLSRVIFLTTANSVHPIPAALLDRLEIIEIPGYTDYEKRKIAERFLVPEQVRENGLTPQQVRFRKDSIDTLINHYTAESGVRNLKREIASVTRKLAREMVERGVGSEEYRRTVTAKTVQKALGPPRFRKDTEREYRSLPGMARGLAWTEIGGVVLTVEVAILDRGDEFVVTGNLGDVMKESARAALSRAIADLKRIGTSAQGKFKGIHVHVPQGAIPKDGPSAGITLYVAILSALLKRPVPNDVAMTGELTLTGRVLPVGGIKEKLLAAARRNIRRIILPEQNQDDLASIPRDLRQGLDLHLVGHVEELLPIVFPASAANLDGLPLFAEDVGSDAHSPQSAIQGVFAEFD
jgi:ATP-dependent Lon protease